MSTPNSPAEAVAFIKRQRDIGSTEWKGLCAKLVRSAYGFTYGIYPSALAAMLATPKKYKVTDPRKVKVGMTGYFVDWDDANPYEHIATCVGHAKDGLPIWGTNLAGGTVGFVDHMYFERNWGDKFNFAASSIGTHVIDQLQPKPKPEVEKGKRLKKTIRELVNVQKAQRKLGRNNIVDRLQKDIDSLRKTLKQIQAK